ncbi:MAG: TraR/DksA family transcriptional regulator [Saprospiraceae bacterium]
MQTQVNRFSAAELEEFQQLVQKNLDKAQSQLNSLEAQIEDVNEDEDDHGKDLMDDSNVSSQMEMLTTMRNRQKIHIRDLENALIRIRNKSYGICIVTGELIDKRRLFAVPTTTKSVAGKVLEATPQKKEIPVRKPSTTVQSYSRIIKKVSTTPIVKNEQLEDDFLDDDDDDDDDLEFDDNDNYIDPDSLSDDDLD